jgi:hypothetical protein
MIAQAGSSISLICFLIIVRLSVFAVLNPHTSAQPVSEVSLPAPKHDKNELKESLQLLEADPDCSNLLKCLDFHLDVRIKSAEQFHWCKKSYMACKSHGLLNHLNQLLDAADEVA